MTRLGTFGFALMMCSISAPCFAEELRGALDVSAEFAKQIRTGCAKRSCYWNERNGVIPAEGKVLDIPREFNVVLTANNGPSMKEINAKFWGGQLMPHTVVATPQSLVVIHNEDFDEHHLSAPGLTGFEGQSVPPQGLQKVSIKQSGKWKLIDHKAPSFKGSLVVIDGLVALAEIESDGSFVFRGLNPGDYELLVYHRGEQVYRKALKVGASSKAIQLDSASIKPKGKS